MLIYYKIQLIVIRLQRALYIVTRYYIDYETRAPSCILYTTNMINDYNIHNGRFTFLWNKMKTLPYVSFLFGFYNFKASYKCIKYLNLKLSHAVITKASIRKEDYRVWYLFMVLKRHAIYFLEHISWNILFISMANKNKY